VLTCFIEYIKVLKKLGGKDENRGRNDG